VVDAVKHLLMIVPFFPPMSGGGVFRPLSFVRYLPQHGWRTTVIAPRGDAFWIRDETLLDSIPAECRVVRTATWSGQRMLSALRGREQSNTTRSSRGFGRARKVGSAVLVPDTYIGWYPFALRAALRAAKAQRFDALYSTSPPETSHLVGHRVHAHTRLPWLADFRDPWMNLRLLDPPSGLHARFHRALEARVCTHANAVVVATRWHEAVLKDAYPSARVERISNGYDGDDIRSVASLAPARAPMRFLHAGMLTQKRSATAFLEALARFFQRHPQARAEVRVDFVGAREDENERAVARLGLADVVELRGTVAHSDALRMERQAHVLLLIKHADSRYDGLVPGKLYEYVGLGRPILALAPPGEARALVESLRRGETAAPDDVGTIATKIEVLYRHFRAGTLDSAYDLSPVPALERERQAGELARVLDAIAGVRS
jgi:glycosyl transferase family 1/glycosyl transferase family 4